MRVSDKHESVKCFAVRGRARSPTQFAFCGDFWAQTSSPPVVCRCGKLRPPPPPPTSPSSSPPAGSSSSSHCCVISGLLFAEEQQPQRIRGVAMARVSTNIGAIGSKTNTDHKRVNKRVCLSILQCATTTAINPIYTVVAAATVLPM